MPNNPNAADNLKPFVKGDPRINRKGRPKSFDALRDLAQAISHEEAATKGQEIIIADKVIIEKGEPIIIKGHKVTVAEMILRSWAQSKNPQLQRAFMEIAFGKVPDKVELSGDVNLDLGKLSDDELELLAKGK